MCFYLYTLIFKQFHNLQQEQWVTVNSITFMNNPFCIKEYINLIIRRTTLHFRIYWMFCKHLLKSWTFSSYFSWANPDRHLRFVGAAQRLCRTPADWNPTAAYSMHNAHRNPPATRRSSNILEPYNFVFVNKLGDLLRTLDFN